jgi:DNA helicase-2/ATP-dependent DNA helicase PcrA
MVGGFSFYERAEIRDMLSYLKLVLNPHDSVALQRCVNTPTRGIGKTTLETLERLALETGVSTWEAIEQATRNQLVPARACVALDGFRQVIKDARALMHMDGSDFAGKLAADVAGDSAEPVGEADAGSDAGFEFGENASFDFVAGADAGDGTDFDFGADVAPEQAPMIDLAMLSPFHKSVAGTGSKKVARKVVTSALGESDPADRVADLVANRADSGFRKRGDRGTLPELIRFLIDRSGYIRVLEQEGSPEAVSRIENLKELANAAQDAEERGETLSEFLDHAALVSDTDKYSEDAKVTLMSLHAAKGLEFPLVFLTGMEEGLFPHSRTLNDPNGLEEERRLCYVGMTRAMDTLVLTRAQYRRRYGNDAPEASVASRFLEEIPGRLVENLGTPMHRREASGGGYGSGYRNGGQDDFGGHYSYEDEDQSSDRTPGRTPLRAPYAGVRATAYPSSGMGSGMGGKPVVWTPQRKAGADAGKPAEKKPDSLDNIAQFFSGKAGGGGFSRPKLEVPAATGASDLQKGMRVRHGKYGDGTVILREGDGEDAKLTVHFARFGVKKLIEKFAQLVKI